MAHALTCPSCGETEELHGEPHEGDIRVRCARCGAVWMRGEPVCATCGGAEIVERPQAMTRHSRGTQLSIIGWRQLPLCRTCDAEALRASITENVAVPDSYVSAALHAPGSASGPAGSARDEEDAGAPAPSAGPRPPAKGRTPSTVKPEARSAVSAQRPSGTAKAPAAKRPVRRGRPQPAPTAVPTVRQAIQAFLSEGSGDLDHTAMLLLGTHLGSYQRLDVLEGERAREALTEWFAGHWGEPGTPAEQGARATVCRAMDFWGARGWLSSDPAAGLR
ncbi:hypothetical protein GCM10009716_28230 [Streptomyces sodiiphilus]|uniref:Uncharacterized protein n=1 Tax=Streptomyces sodiiphilus TaxID=226217 RepID=A0ABN2PCH7_9ACTN